MSSAEKCAIFVWIIAAFQAGRSIVQPEKWPIFIWTLILALVMTLRIIKKEKE